MSASTSSSSLPLEDSDVYGIDPLNGFLPGQEPLRRLWGQHGSVWETMLHEAVSLPLLFSGGSIVDVPETHRERARSWRARIRSMPTLTFTVEELEDVRFARRARVVLSFLAHFYIHSQPEPVKPTFSQRYFKESSIIEEESRGKYKTTLPASIAIPWTIISKHLELPTILTYADTVLWNWHLTDPRLGFQSNNLSITTTFTDSQTEKHFFKTSLLIELQGAQILRLIQSLSLSLLKKDQQHHHQMLTLTMKGLVKIIHEMTQIFKDITTDCDPSEFYWTVRTWFNGSDTSAMTYNSNGDILHQAGQGWIFEGVYHAEEEKDNEQPVLLSGPSAGQSSIIHSLDVFLGVDHTPVKPSSNIPPPPPQEDDGISQPSPPPKKINFMQRMQKYMPGPHRRYLTDLDTYLHAAPNNQQTTNTSTPHQSHAHLIKSLASQTPESLTAYNEAVTALCSLRDQHMRIVALYILIPARQPPPTTALHHRQAAALPDTIRIKVEGDKKGERGTGGTELVSFLKSTRDRTRQARLEIVEAATTRIVSEATREKCDMKIGTMLNPAIRKVEVE